MPTIEITEFVVVEALPICETGIDYPASTGPFSITRSMIQSAIEFANEDPHGLAPRIKIAHGDTPINDDLQSLFEQYQTGRDASVPSLGTILNLAAVNDGHTLVGDWYGLPGWLAAILQSAYPSRSLEGGSWQNPANNKIYDFKIDAVSLLGVVGPGCTSLEDIQELFSETGPKVTVIEMSTKSTKMGGKDPMPALQVNVEDIRRSFYDSFAQGDRWWWWDRELLSDPWEFIASDENGDLWRVPFTPIENDNGDTEVESWGEPSPIKIKFIPDPSRETSDDGEPVAAAVMMVSAQVPEITGTLLAVNNKPLRIKPKQKEAKPAMAIDVPALRTRLGISEEDLPDDATEEQINAALAAEPDEETEETDPEAETTPPAGTDAGVTDDGDFKRVHKDVWDETRRGAQLAIKQQRERDRSDNDTFLETAIREGRITRASKKSYLTQMNGGEGENGDGRGPARDSLRTMITTLEKGVSMPINEIGHSEGEALEMSTQGTGLFPKLDAARAARTAKEA